MLEMLNLGAFRVQTFERRTSIGQELNGLTLA